jgi:hypothetical protein
LVVTAAADTRNQPQAGFRFCLPHLATLAVLVFLEVAVAAAGPLRRLVLERSRQLVVLEQLV